MQSYPPTVQLCNAMLRVCFSELIDRPQARPSALWDGQGLIIKFQAHALPLSYFKL